MDAETRQQIEALIAQWRELVAFIPTDQNAHRIFPTARDYADGEVEGISFCVKKLEALLIPSPPTPKEP